MYLPFYHFWSWNPLKRRTLSIICIQLSSVPSFSSIWLFATPWIAARQASLSITNSRSSLRLTSIKSVMSSSCLIHPLSFPSPPAPYPSQDQGFFSSGKNLFTFAWGSQSIGVSALASVLPTNIQDWSPLGWTGWIALQSKGLSRVFSNTTVQKHQFFNAQLSSQSNSHVHTWPQEKP